MSGTNDFRAGYIEGERMSEKMKLSGVVLTERETDGEMHLITPQHLYDDPKEWLNVPHELHESLLRLMSHMFPDFKNKLERMKLL